LMKYVALLVAAWPGAADPTDQVLPPPKTGGGRNIARPRLGAGSASERLGARALTPRSSESLCFVDRPRSD